MSGPLMLVLCEYTSDDEVACEHAYAAHYEDRLPTKLVDIHYSWDGRKKHHDSDDACGK